LFFISNIIETLSSQGFQKEGLSFVSRGCSFTTTEEEEEAGGGGKACVHCKMMTTTMSQQQFEDILGVPTMTAEVKAGHSSLNKGGSELCLGFCIVR
jgi:hypothetical protein